MSTRASEDIVRHCQSSWASSNVQYRVPSGPLAHKLIGGPVSLVLSPVRGFDLRVVLPYMYPSLIRATLGLEKKANTHICR